MLQMMVKIVQTNPGGKWYLQVSSTPPNGSPYFFQKTDFGSAQEAKTFLIMNIRMFALNMGQV